MKPTEQQLQDIYEEAVSAECAEKQGEEMSSFDLLCKLDEAGGLATFIRTMIDTVRATRRQQPTAYLNDAYLGRGHVEGEVGEEGDAPGMIPVYREPLDCLYILDALTEQERAELEDYRRCLSEDREMLKRLAVILSGSDSGGEIAALTVTAQSFVDRCKTLAKERGNYPEIPEGWKLVPEEPTEAMMLNESSCHHHAWDDPDCSMRQTRRFIWKRMVEAAPKPNKQ